MGSLGNSGMTPSINHFARSIQKKFKVFSRKFSGRDRVSKVVKGKAAFLI